jgi:hypothetical protein
VGTLIEPTTKAQYLAGTDLPTNLFSHPDQQLEWQNASQSGSISTGWAGRIADALNGTYNTGASVPMVTSVAGDTLFCNGSASTPVSVSPGNLGGAQCSEGTTECGAQLVTAQALLSFDSGLTLVQADNTITSNAYAYAKTLSAAVQSVSPLKTVFPANNGLAAQLQQISQIIQVRAALGVSRQIFFCGIGNFDTHSNQLALQNALLASISPALAAFYAATVELGVEHRQRPRVGIAPHCDGRCGEGRAALWDLPDARAQRPGRLGEQWALGAIDRQRAVCGYAGLMVRCERGGDADGLPEHRKLCDGEPGICLGLRGVCLGGWLGGLDRLHVDGDLERVRSAAQHQAVQRTHVAVVAAPGEGHVAI